VSRLGRGRRSRGVTVEWEDDAESAMGATNTVASRARGGEEEEVWEIVAEQMSCD
jgi:hypothetical protein